MGALKRLNTAIETSDVVMLLRIQHERHEGESDDDLLKVNITKLFGLTIEREKRMKLRSIIMHPAPVNRNVEIADELVECESVKNFYSNEKWRFCENGCY